MEDLLIHRSISDLYRSLEIPIEQELDFTIHSLPDIHPKVPFKSPVFRTDYFSFVFMKDADGSYTTDDQSFQTNPNTVYFTNPGHIKSFAIDRLKDAYIITLTESFLRENVHPDVFQEFPFLLAETVAPKVLEAEEFKEYERLYKQIYLEFHKKASPYKSKILGNLFVVLLLKIKEKFWHHYDPIEEGDRHSEIVRKFKQLLEIQFSTLSNDKSEAFYQVQDYAHQLNLHPGYFSQVIKSKTGQTVNQWIQKRQISLANSWLKNSERTIKEIGYQLGFREATHFSRFYRNATGKSPNQYRKEVS